MSSPRAVASKDPSCIEELDLVREFLLESNQNLLRLEHDISELQRRPKDANILASIYRTVHTIKGNCGFLGFTTLESVAHDTENLLSQAHAGQCELDSEFMARILEAKDAIVSSLRRIEPAAPPFTGRAEPPGTLWDRLPLQVRYLADCLGKEIHLKIEDADTKFGTGHIEAIRDPLIHLIRNACDHGIEDPEERARAGKPRCGTLHLRVYRDVGCIVLEVSDDGAGIDRDLLDSVFLPGFSTATRVTKVSGRGIGLDVVRSTVERLGGAVDITTTPGQGTAVRLRIPDSTAQISSRNYRYLQELIYQGSGIVLDDAKHYLLEDRLQSLVREQGAATINDLCSLLRESRDASLKKRVVEAITTNETYFFREPEHYEALRGFILPRLIETRNDTRCLRFWSAASSTGQEAYSLAMLLLEMDLADWNIQILGTDLCSPVLDRARSGIFSRLEMTRGLPASYAGKYFDPIGPQWRANDELKRMIRFQSFDLRSSMRDLGPFDVVFCRNVLIYFDLATKTKVIESIRRTLTPGGLLFLGATETTLPPSNLFDRKGIGAATVYQAF